MKVGGIDGNWSTSKYSQFWAREASPLGQTSLEREILGAVVDAIVKLKSSGKMPLGKLYWQRGSVAAVKPHPVPSAARRLTSSPGRDVLPGHHDRSDRLGIIAFTISLA